MKNENSFDATNKKSVRPKCRQDRIRHLNERGVHVDESITHRRLQAIEELVAITPSLFELGRLQADEIEAIPPRLLPTIRTVCGRKWKVDFCGLLHPGRQYKIDFRGFRHYVPIAKKFLQTAIEDGAVLKTPTICSYTLKHYFQSSLGYVSNGGFIAAASELRIPLHFSGINVSLPISKIWLKKWEQMEADRARGEVPIPPSEIESILSEGSRRLFDALKQNRPTSWKGYWGQIVSIVRHLRSLEASMRLKTERERDYYMDQIAARDKMPELIRNVSMFWKLKKNHRHWYVQFEESIPNADVIVSRSSLLVLGIDRQRIDELASIAESFRPRPILQTDDRFLAPNLSFAQIVELLEVVQERVGRFATADFLPTIEEWDLADK